MGNVIENKGARVNMELYQQKRKKLNLRVKRNLQAWILIRILVVILISIAISLFILYLFSHRQIGTTFHRAHLTIRHVSDLLLPVIVASGGLCVLAGFLFAIFFPQRIAGPIYRIERGLKEISTGNFKHVFKLRKTDHFQSLAEAANEAMRRVAKELEDLENQLKSIEEILDRGENELAKEKIVVLRKRLENLLG